MSFFDLYDDVKSFIFKHSSIDYKITPIYIYIHIYIYIYIYMRIYISLYMYMTHGEQDLKQDLSKTFRLIHQTGV